MFYTDKIEDLGGFEIHNEDEIVCTLKEKAFLFASYTHILRSVF